MANSKLSRFRAIRPLLRVIIFVFAAIALILACAAWPMALSADFYADGLGATMVIIVIPIATYSMLWTIVAMIVLFFNGPYHPAIDIGFDIIGWGGGWGCGILTIIITEYLSDVELYCDSYWYDYREECGAARRFDGIFYSAGVFQLIFGSIFLALWIMSCKATQERRMMAKRESFHELDDMKDAPATSAGPA